MTSYDTIRNSEFKLHGDIVRLRYIATNMRVAELRGLNDLDALVIGHRFRVAVVGEFNRGKSTAINALLGAEVLPASIEACSAALNRVTYGSSVTARVVMRGDGPPEMRSEAVPLDQLVSYVTKLSPDAARMASSVEEAVITYPSPFCRNNVDLIDTPGLNDEQTMTAVTIGAIRRVNAAIVVIRAIISFSQSEKVLLGKLLDQDVTNLIFLVTAIDELDPDDRPRTLREVQKRIAKAIAQYAADTYDEESEEYAEFLQRVGSPQVYGVSALTALEAKMHANLQHEQASGYPAFESALERMLATRNGAASVAQVARKLSKECDLLIHQIGQMRQVHAESAIATVESETNFVRGTEIARAEIAAQMHMLQQDGENLRRACTQSMGDMSPILMRQINAVLADLSISGNDVVTFAGILLQDPARAEMTTPAQRTWILASTSAYVTPGIQALQNLHGQFRMAIQRGWHEVIYSLVRQIYRGFEQIAGSAVAAAEKIQHQYAEVAVGLQIIMVPVTYQPVEEQIKQIQQQLSEQRRTIVEHLIHNQAPTLRVMPPLLALRAVLRVIEQPTPGPAHERFVAEMKESCLRAITSDLEGQYQHLTAQIEPLLTYIGQGCAELLRPLTEISHVVSQQEGSILSQLHQARASSETTRSYDVRQLNQYEQEIAAIRDETHQMLHQLETGV